MILTCTQCHKAFRTGDNADGKILKCPQCGGQLAQRQSNPAQSAPAADPQVESPATDYFRDFELPDAQPAAANYVSPLIRRRKQSSLLPLAIVGAAAAQILLLLVLFAAGVFSPPANANKDAVARTDSDADAAAARPKHSGDAAAQPIAVATTAPTAPPRVANDPFDLTAGTASTPSTSTSGSATAAAGDAPSKSPAAIEPINVLQQINPALDAARAHGRSRASGLSTPRSGVGTLRLPVVPPAEYQLTLVLNRVPVSTSPGAIVVVPGQRALRCAPTGPACPASRGAAVAVAD